MHDQNDSESVAEKIFANALNVSDPQERRKYVERQCHGDMALRQMLDELLTVSDRRDGILYRRPWKHVDSQHICAPGTHIGNYQIVGLLDEGGMGAVYEAQQQRPVRRVALKVLKPDSTPQVESQFRNEINNLAKLVHPNVATIFDAGITDDGVRFFAMELIEGGLTLPKYCDEFSPTRQEKLSLFVEICRAIAHAHQKQVIHQDVKPTNVLVSNHEGKPSAKVIDFGISLDSGTNSVTLPWGTGGYMSPERRQGASASKASDIYSLGVVLRELLCGCSSGQGTGCHPTEFEHTPRDGQAG